MVILRHIPPTNDSRVSGEELEPVEVLTHIARLIRFGSRSFVPLNVWQSWNQKMGDARLLVPGQLLSAPFLNYIKIDSESGELTSTPAR